MRKKLILFLMLALFGSTSFLRADVFEVQIGEGTSTTGYFPFYTLYNYSIAESLYLASELQDAGVGTGNLTSLSWYATNSTGYEQQGISLWMANVTDAELTTSSHVVTGMTLVYTGSVTPQVGWNEFVFNEGSFAWDGTSNILIYCQRNNGDWNSTISWQATTGLSFQAMAYKYQDSGAYDPTVSQTLSTSTTRPNIIFKGENSGGGGGGGGSSIITDPWTPDYDLDLGAIEIVSPTIGQQNLPANVTLSWHNAENAAQYKIELGTVYGSLETIVDWTDITDEMGWNGSLNLASLDITIAPNTRYFWKVYNNNNTGSVESELASFTGMFNTATNVKVVPDEIFTDGSTVVKWSIVGGAVGELPETVIGSGDGSTNYLPTYNLYNYSLTQQIYTLEEIGNAGIINSITFKPLGSITRNLDIYMVNTDKTSFSGANDWITVTAEDRVFSGSVSMAAPQTTVTLENPFFFDGTNLAIIVNDLTGTWTSSIYYASFAATAQAIRIYQDEASYNPLAPGSYSGTVMNEKNQITINSGRQGEAGNRDLVGCNVYVDSILMNTDGPITERQYDLSMTHAAGLGVAAYNMEGHSVCVTGVYDYGESNYSAPALLYVSGYGSLSGTVKELMSNTGIGGVNVKFTGKDEFNNNQTYQVTSNPDGSYAISNVKAGNYDVEATCENFDPVTIEGIVVSNNVVTTVDIIYMHENYNPVYKVYAAEGDVLGAQVADVIWSFGNFDDPTPGGGNGGGGGGGGGTGAGSTFTENFEGGLNGWTTIDADGDGLVWYHSSQSYTYSCYEYTGLGHNGTDGFVYSQSYTDCTYDSYNPDNFLVSPAKYDIVNGSTLTFWVDNANDSYPDHFGVAVATAATPTASDFTVVWEGGAKNGGNKAAVRHDDNRYNNWRQHTVDLSAYAGQSVWIAFRHFNSYDEYEIWIDDVELTAGTKSAPAHAEACGTHIQTAPARDMWDLVASFNGTSAGQQGVCTDGDYIYTASWQTTPTGGFTFYKYELDGTFIEGFNITGATGIRDLTTDGEYFYGTSGGASIFILDLANQTLVGTMNFSGCTSRHISYDPERDAFWCGNWSTMDLYDRNGAHVQTGAAPSSAYGSAYYKDQEGVEHLYLFCQPNSDAKVYDYNIATNTISGPVFDFSSTPGFNEAIAGGCFIADYAGKACWFGNAQQDPNLVGIYELGPSQSGPVVNGGSNLATNDHYFQIWRRPILKENMPTDPAEIEALAIQIDETDHSLGFNDTLYTDMNYMSLEAGIYEYGIAAVYPWVDRSDFNVTGIVWSNDLDHNMTGNLTINGTCSLGVDQVVGAVVTLVNNNESYTYEAELDSVGSWSTEEFRKGDYTLTVDLPGYLALVTIGADVDTVPADGLVMNLWNTEEINIEFVEDYAPVNWLTVSSTGFARWSDMLPQDRVAQRYHVLCDEIFQDETENNYMFLNTDNLVEGETYTAAVAVIYETGMSDFVTANFTYMSCENVGTQVDDLDGTVDLADVTLSWAGGNGSGVVPPPPGGATTFTEGFESGLPTGWTVVDGNNDGWTWCLTSDIPSTWTYYTMTIDWYRTGTNAICSGSYINGVGALTPNEYLVTDQVNLAAGSTFSFWAAATDASYPADHFGVFVSDDATNWTSVQEWTLTGKKGGNDGGRASRDGKGARLGTWYNYSVDLSSYAGQKYIAIRHFNCNDQYIMCVDDIELSAGSKDGFSFGNAGQGFGLANNSLADDGNWYYYDNGNNVDAIGLTGGGSFYWGVMFPAGTYTGTNLTKVAMYDYSAHTGNVLIYQGGASAPTTLMGQQAYTCTESKDFIEVTFDTPITLDPAQNLWVVLNNNNGQYVAACCNNTGDANGRWISLDGSSWEDVAGYGLDYTWMIRAYVEEGGVTPPPTPGTTAITPNAFNIFMDGELIGATTDTTFTYTCEDDVEHQYCVMFVDADYNVSCAQCINITADPLGVGQYNVVSAIYPNPTNGNLYINTNANMKSISVINVLGQMVYNKAAEGTETVIDMAQFGNGIYMVSIVTENGTSVNRIIVNK